MSTLVSCHLSNFVTELAYGTHQCMDTPSSLSREQLESLVDSLKEQLQSVSKQNTELKEHNEALTQEVKTVPLYLISNILGVATVG